MATFINMYFNRLLKFPKIESASKPVYIYKLIDLYRINVFALPLLLDNPS